jgi:DeoR family transcriptional regulator, fructose operon transcriptional repressor
MKERQLKILNRLFEKDELEVLELSKLTGVSEVTIRRDLIDLDYQRLIKKSRGKTKISKIGKKQVLNNKRFREYYDEKQALGIEAAQTIKSGESIIIDTGSTALQFAKALAGRDLENIKIITCSIMAAQAFQFVENIEVFVIGGVFRADRMIMSGTLAEKGIRQYVADYAIISVDGISLKNGLTTRDTEAASLGEAMMDSAQKTIVLADHSKVGKNAFAKFAELKDVAELYVDSKADKKEINIIKNTGVKVNTVKVI